MRKLLITVAVLVALFLAADFGLKAVAEAESAKVLQSSLRLSTKPSVSLGGFPFLAHFASGDFPDVTLEAHRFTADKVPIQLARILMHDVRFSTSQLLGGKTGTVKVGSGDGTATLTGDGVTAALRAQGVGATVRLEGGKAVISSPDLPGGKATGELEVRNGLLVLRSSVAGTTYSLPLPQIVRGISYTGARIEGDMAVLAFTVERTSFKL